MRPKQVVATVRKLRILDSDNAMSSATLKNWDRFMSPEQSHRPRTLKRAHSETSQSSEADFPTETEERAHKRRILAGPSEAKPLVSEGSTELSALQRERSSSLSSTSTIAVSPSSSPPPVSDPATCLQPLEMSTQQLKQAFQIISLSATISIDRMSAREEELRKKDVYLEERNKRQQKREVDMKKDYEKLRAWKHSLTEKYKKEGQSLEKQWKDLQEEKRNTDEIKRRSEELDKEKDAFEAVRQEHNMKHENAMKYWGERNDQLTSEREEFEKEKLAMEKEKEDRLVELEKEKLAMQKDKEDRLVEIQKEMQHMMAKYLTGN
ncbi:hypothetical protein BJ508DRAFT_116138 [Ascobolus immersus RN42]|uniref:Uncharacterized protein n=1 Tax=Ascobolus immersus RN42 TaxID=1160509 RepID=A0A3N4I744_ASCIM|nr:hypothetical protein BJ508DRAFT_116138 [Ascobolus immersus RN42]